MILWSVARMKTTSFAPRRWILARWPAPAFDKMSSPDLQDMSLKRLEHVASNAETAASAAWGERQTVFQTSELP